MKRIKKRNNNKKQSIGLGDTVEKITEATGIKKVVKFLFGEDCGCDERKEKLNKWKPYIECLKYSEYKYLTEWFKHNKINVSYKERTELIKIYNRVFKKQQKDTSCGSCVRNIINDLKRVYNEY